MRRADYSVLEKKPNGERDGRGAPRFCKAEEEISRFSKRVAGKIVLITDGAAAGVLASSYSAPRILSVVLDGEDALPLFALPDGIGGVIGTGGARTLAAARFFAKVFGVPCLLVPLSAALDGVFGEWGEVLLDGVKRRLPLAEAETVYDPTRLKPSLAEGYARLLLCRLALFERRMLARFGEGEFTPLCERAYALTEPVPREEEGILSANEALRRLEAEGLPVGEGRTLSHTLSGDLPDFAAYRLLSGLYGCFFRVGTPRRYFVPDYRARAAQAGVPYSSVSVPTLRRYAHRAFALEAMRAAACAEWKALTADGMGHFRTLRALGGYPDGEISPAQMKNLPELCPGGLSAVIRDFGLMEL